MASQDEIVFGSEEEFNKLLKEAKTAFKKAALINPNNEHAAYWSGSIHWSPALTEKLEKQEEEEESSADT